MILAEDRDEYLDALGEADGGHLDAFVAFVAERVIDTFDLAALTLRAGREADAAKSLEALRRASAATAGLTNAELDALAQRVLQTFSSELAATITQAGLPPGVSISAEDTVIVDSLDAPTGYRIPTTAPHAVVLVGQAAPAPTQVRLRISVLVATTRDRSPLALEAEGEQVGFSLRDVEPRVRDLARLKMTAFAEMFVARLLARLADHSR